MLHLKNDRPDRARESLDGAARDFPVARSPMQRWQHRQHPGLAALDSGQAVRARELMLQKGRGADGLLLNGIAAAR